MALEVGKLVAYIDADSSGYDATVDRSEGRFKAFAGAIATGAKRAAQFALGVGIAAGGIGIKTAASMEQADIAFTTMLGSGAKAKTFLTDLRSFANSTPFEFPELQIASQSLISAGVNADKVIPIMRSLGDATSGMGTGSEGVKRATVALQQMNAAGKITGEDLNQLRDAGIPVYDLLAAATGKSKEQVAELAQKGKLGRQELTQLMTALESGKGLEKFNGMMDAQSKSLSGLVSNFKDAVNNGLAEAVQPLIPLLKDGLVVAIDLVAANMPRLKEGLASAVAVVTDLVKATRDGNLGEKFGDLSAAGATLGPAFKDAVSIVRSMTSALPELSTLTNTAATVIGFLAEHADKLAAVLPAVAVAYGSYRIAAALGNVVALATLPIDAARVASNFALAGALKASAAANAQQATTAAIASNTVVVSSARQGAAFLASKIAMGASAVATGIATAAQWALNAAMSANPIALVVIAIAALVAALVVAYQNSETFRNIVNAAWSAIQTGVAAVIGWLTTAVPAVFSWIKDAFLKYTPLGLVISHWGQIQAFIGGAVDRVRSIITWFAGLPGQFAAWFGGVTSAAVGRLGELVAWVGGLPGRVLSAIGNLGGLLVDKGADLIRGLMSGIGSMGGQLVSYVRDFVLSNIPGPIASVLGIRSPSKLMADEVGRWIPAGIEQGIAQGAPSLNRAMTSLVDVPIASSSYPGASSSLMAGSSASTNQVVVYVENPFTGEYLRARLAQSAAAVISAQGRETIYGGV